MTTKWTLRRGSPMSDSWADMPAGRAVLCAIAALACVVTVVLVGVDAPTWVRFPAVLMLFCVGPGTALLALLTPAERPLDLGLVVATSLALMTLGAQAMLWLRIWSPDASLMLMALVSLGALVASVLRGR